MQNNPCKTNTHDIRIRAAKGNATFFVSILGDARNFRRRRFKQRKGRSSLQARLFSSNAIPYASVTLPRRPLSPMSFFTLSLFPFLCSLVFFIFLGCLLPSALRVSSSRLTPMSIFPYRLIRKEASLPSLCTGFSFISLFLPFDPFFIRRANPSSPFPATLL